MRDVTAVLLRGRGTAARFMAEVRRGTLRRSRRRAKPGAPPPQGAVTPPQGVAAPP